jgi:hypothetical protein
MRARKRRWEQHAEDDPLAGLINLFDLWMVFSIALLLALFARTPMAQLLSHATNVTVIKNAGQPDMEIIQQHGTLLEHYRVSNHELGGEGERLGTAYRLKTGEVVYVPEPSATQDANSEPASSVRPSRGKP